MTTLRTEGYEDLPEPSPEACFKQRKWQVSRLIYTWRRKENKIKEILIYLRRTLSFGSRNLCCCSCLGRSRRASLSRILGSLRASYLWDNGYIRDYWLPKSWFWLVCNLVHWRRLAKATYRLKVIDELKENVKEMLREWDTYWSTIVFHVVQQPPSCRIKLGSGSHHYGRRGSRRGNGWSLPDFRCRCTNHCLENNKSGY